MDKLSLQFSNLVCDVAEILNKSSTNLDKLKLFLCTIKDSEGSLLFSKQKSAEIYNSKTIYETDINKVIYNDTDWLNNFNNQPISIIFPSTNVNFSNGHRHEQSDLNHEERLDIVSS